MTEQGERAGKREGRVGQRYELIGGRDYAGGGKRIRERRGKGRA